jgi:hypothetical protein
MKQVIIECRKFDEWDADTQEKILAVHGTINVDGIFWYDSIESHWLENLVVMGYYDNIQISFSGFSCQGDGASVTGNLDLNKWISQANLPAKFNRIKKLMKANRITGYADIIRHNNHYVHERSTKPHCTWEFQTNRKHDYTQLWNLMMELEELLEADMVATNHQIYRDYEDEYDVLTNDEAIARTLRDNEYEFDKNGKIYN